MRLVAEYEQVASAESQRAFARRRGVSSSTLGSWLSRCRHEAPAGTDLVPMVVRSSKPSPGMAPALVIRLGEEPVLELVEPERVPPDWLGELLRELSRGPR